MKVKQKRFSNILTSRSILPAGLILLSLALFSLPLLNVTPLWAAMGLAEQEPDAVHAGPDLIVESITLSIENPKAGDEVDITVILKNQGDADASEYGFYLYVDPTDNPPTQNTLHTTPYRHGFPLAAGASSSAWTRTGHKFTQDDWRVCVWADRNARVEEDDETNNILCIPEETTEIGADDFENDDLCTDAKEIATDGTAQDHNLFREGGQADEDWVLFTVTGGIPYVAEAKPKSGEAGENADLSIEVHTTCGGNTFGSSSGTRVEFTPPVDSTIYVMVKHSQEEYNSQNTAYDLTINGDPGCSTAGEPNNICANAADIGAGSGAQTYAFCKPDDVDWLRIPTQAGAKYKVNLVNEGAQANAQINLFTSCDQAAADGIATEFTAPSAGFAYLMVENLDPAVHGRETAYEMEVTIVGDEEGCAEDSFEQDDIKSDANLLEVGGEPQKHNVCPSQDVDWFSFEATGGVTHTIETLNLAPSSDTVLCLYDEADTEIACNDDEGPGKGSRLVVIPSEKTSYWAKVRDYNPEVAGSETAYDIQVIGASCEDDNFEPNDIQSDAKIIDADGSLQVHNVCPKLDADWVAFTASANTTYAIETTEQNREGDTIIELYDDTGNRLARNDDFTPGVNSRLIYSIDAAGTYYVKTTLYNPTLYGTGTEYELTIKVSDVTPTPTPIPPPGTPSPTPTPGPDQQTNVETLILVNRTQIAQLYNESKADQLMGKLNTLAEHERVKGHVIRLDNNGEVSTAYANWNADLSSVSKANLVTDAIRRIVLTYVQERKGVRYVVLVGDDRALPFRRVFDNTPRQSENTYRNRVDGDHPTGAAIHGNNYLVDDFYVDAKPSIVKGREVYIPDMAIGRLIETPEDMVQTIDNFIASPSTKVDNFYVSGYDFVSDLAQDDCNKWGEALADEGEVMCLIESDTNRWTKEEFVSGHLRADPSTFKFQSISGHAEHYAEGVSGGGSLLGREIDNTTPFDLSGGLLYTVGCHGGLNVPSSNTREPIDLAEAYVRKGANYVGNTGYGWGLLNSIGLSERTYQLFSQNLRSNQYSMGDALKEAKNTYFEKDPSFSAYDEKVVQQMIFYGLPMYGIEVGSLSLGDDNEEDPFAGLVNFDVDPLPLGTFSDDAETITRPISIDFGPAALGSEREDTGNGSIISLNGSTSSGANEAELPLHYGTLSGGDDREEKPRSVLFLGAEYTVEENFDAAIGQPYNEFYTDTTELLAQDEGWFPPVPASLRIHNGEANLLTTAGQYNAEEGELRLYSSLNAEVYYSTNTDEAAPTITIVDALFNPNTDNVSVKVGATDESEIDRVVVSYIENPQNSTSIKALDMTFNASNQKWEGIFSGDVQSKYFVQVVDKAGNMKTETNKGLYYSPAEDVQAARVESTPTPTPTPTPSSTPTPNPSSGINVYLPLVR